MMFQKLKQLKNQSGNVFFSLLILLVLVFFGGYFVFYILFGYTVPPGYIGVRQIKFGPGQGFSKEGLPPGSHWGLPSYAVVHLIPQTIQALHLNRQGKTGNGYPPLEVQTSEAKLDVDVTILTSFFHSPGKEGSLTHGGPSDLLQSRGITRVSWENHIRGVVEDNLRRELGKISTGQFYDPDLREAAVREAHASSNTRLAPYGIKLEAILLRRYTYKEDRINEAIFKKNLQDQEERLNEAGAAFAKAQAELEMVAAKEDATIKTEKITGENQAKVIYSEGELYENEKHALGDLEVAKARAEVDRLKASALARSEGANVYVARELAAVLGSLKGGIVSGMDPYNFNEIMNKLGVGDPPGGKE